MFSSCPRMLMRGNVSCSMRRTVCGHDSAAGGFLWGDSLWEFRQSRSMNRIYFLFLPLYCRWIAQFEILDFICWAFAWYEAMMGMSRSKEIINVFFETEWEPFGFSKKGFVVKRRVVFEVPLPILLTFGSGASAVPCDLLREMPLLNKDYPYLSKWSGEWRTHLKSEMNG